MTAWQQVATLPPGVDLDPAHPLFVIGAASVPSPDLALATLAFPDGVNGADAVRVTTSTGVVADTVVYGGANNDGLREDDGNLAATTPGVHVREGWSRVVDGVDTQRSAVDLAWTATPTPGAANRITWYEMPATIKRTVATTTTAHGVLPNDVVRVLQGGSVPVAGAGACVNGICTDLPGTIRQVGIITVPGNQAGPDIAVTVTVPIAAGTGLRFFQTVIERSGTVILTYPLASTVTP